MLNIARNLSCRKDVIMKEFVLNSIRAGLIFCIIKYINNADKPSEITLLLSIVNAFKNICESKVRNSCQNTQAWLPNHSSREKKILPKPSALVLLKICDCKKKWLLSLLHSMIVLIRRWLHGGYSKVIDLDKDSAKQRKNG